jgi:hypothetical protein
MSPVRRGFAALLSTLLLHLVLLGSGTVRALQQEADGAHPMGPAAVTGAPDGNAPMDPSHCNGSGQHDDCRLPITPGPCMSISTCHVNATPAVVAFASVSVPSTALRTPPVLLAHANPTFSPELPPPRA